MKIIGFLHVAKMTVWREILREQLFKLKRFGLFQRSNAIFVTTLGDGDEEGLLADPKLDVTRIESLDRYEFPTLQRLYDYCSQADALVWYIHGKGVSRPSTDYTKMRDWREYMEYFAIERYSNCIRALEHSDVCGVNWRTHREPHFSGNFWWARSSYVRNLPPPAELDQSDRWQAEWWLGCDPQVRATCFYESHLKHYLSHFPRARYAELRTALDALDHTSNESGHASQ